MKKIIMVENQEFFSDVKIGAHHYAEIFANNGYKVLWVSPAFSDFHKFNKEINIKERVRLNKKKFIELKQNIYGYAPKVLLPFVKNKPFNSKFVSKVYLKTAIPSINRRITENGFNDADILWISNVKMLYLKDMIKHQKLVYRVADEKSGFMGFYKTLENMEVELIKESDIVYATAHNILNRCRSIRKDVHYLPNGVNITDFIVDSDMIPKDIKNIKDKKKCIYIGAIAEWLDLDLITKIAGKYTEIEFLFIGPKHIDFSIIENLGNVKYLGKKKYSELKYYLNNSDIAWIPFKKNKLTDSINPVKIYEYMAVGVPTITTDFKEINYINGPFEKCSSFESAIKSFDNCLKGKYKKNELIEFSMKNTWQKRFEKIKESIE